jgi:hypothetical protein
MLSICEEDSHMNGPFGGLVLDENMCRAKELVVRYEKEQLSK